VLAGASWPLVLLPMHIAFLELIIDPACSVVFEAEAEEPGIMSRPPRPANEALFSPRILTISLLQGASALAGVFAIYYWALATGHPEADVRGLTFATLVVSNLALILVNRSWTRTALGGLKGDPNSALGWVFGGALGFLALLMAVPFLREIFRFAPFHVTDIVMVLIASVAGVAWFEVYKVVERSRSRPGSAG